MPRTQDDTRTRSDEEVAQWRQDNRITVIGNGVPKPILTFKEAMFPEYVMKVPLLPLPVRLASHATTDLLATSITGPSILRL